MVMRKLILRTSVLLLGVGLVVGLVVLVSQAPARSVTLANGATLHCLGATYGTNHVTPGYSRLVRLLPSPLRSFLGFTRPTQSFGTDTPLLTVWLQDEPLAASNRLSRIGIVSMVADEQGVLAGNEAWCSLWPGGIGTFNLQFRAVPRRSRAVRIQFFSEGVGMQRTPLGELILPNPALDESPAWEATPLPAERTNGFLVCRLEQLVAGVGYHTRVGSTASGQFFEAAPAEPGHRPQAVGVFRFVEDGQPSTNWVVGTVRLADATGNSMRCGSSSHHTHGDLVAHRFGSILWPNEVWDTTVWAKRKTTASFTGEELIVLNDIDVPPLDGTNRLDRALQAQGIEVRVEQFVRRPPPGPGGYSMSDLTHLRLELSELPEGTYLEVVELRDDQDRRLSGQGWSQSHGEPSVTTFAFKEVPEGAKTISAVLVLQRGRRFDFRVQPQTLAGTNDLRLELNP